MPRPRTHSDLSIADLEKMLDSSRKKVTVLEKKRSKLQKNVEAIDAEIAMLGGSASRGGGRVRNDKSLNEMLADAFAAKGGPMKVQELVDAVKAKGYRSKSANFRGIVNQALIKDKRFVSQSRGIYQLKK